MEAHDDEIAARLVPLSPARRSSRSSPIRRSLLVRVPIRARPCRASLHDRGSRLPSRNDFTCFHWSGVSFSRISNRNCLFSFLIWLRAATTLSILFNSSPVLILVRLHRQLCLFKNFFAGQFRPASCTSSIPSAAHRLVQPARRYVGIVPPTLLCAYPAQALSDPLLFPLAPGSWPTLPAANSLAPAARPDKLKSPLPPKPTSVDSCLHRLLLVLFRHDSYFSVLLLLGFVLAHQSFQRFHCTGTSRGNVAVQITLQVVLVCSRAARLPASAAWLPAPLQQSFEVPAGDAVRTRHLSRFLPPTRTQRPACSHAPAQLMHRLCLASMGRAPPRSRQLTFDSEILQRLTLVLC